MFGKLGLLFCMFFLFVFIFTAIYSDCTHNTKNRDEFMRLFTRVYFGLGTATIVFFSLSIIAPDKTPDRHCRQIKEPQARTVDTTREIINR